MTELAFEFNFLEKKNNNLFNLSTKMINEDELLLYCLYQLKEKNKDSWSRNEQIYLHSIFTNICKNSGLLQLDSYDALHDFYCLLQQANQKKGNDLQFVLRDIDTRLSLNRNSTHKNHIQNLPFGLQYILHPKFFWAFFAGICCLSKWFFQVYTEMALSIFAHINNTKVSLGQVLYTEYFVYDRTALLLALSKNMLFVKTIEVYNLFLQFHLSSGQIFLWIWNFLSTICFSWDCNNTKNERIIWSFFENHLKLSQITTSMEEVKENEVNKNYFQGFLPNFFSSFFQGENLSKNTMKAIRLGATPSRDITILMETIHKVTDEGEYIFYILSSCFSILFLLLVTYLIIYLSSWFLSYRVKNRLLQKIKFKYSTFQQQ